MNLIVTWLILIKNGWFHDDFHTRTISNVPFAMFSYLVYQNKHFAIHFRVWPVNMIWRQFVETSTLCWYSVERTFTFWQKMLKSWFFWQFDIKSCLLNLILITLENEWWNFYFDANNTKISKNIRLKSFICGSHGEINQWWISV